MYKLFNGQYYGLIYKYIFQQYSFNMYFVVKRQFIQLAKHKGIKTINLVRRAECVSELKSLGADEVINIACEGLMSIFMFVLWFKIVNLQGFIFNTIFYVDITLRVKEITNGRLAYAAMDAVGGTLTKVHDPYSLYAFILSCLFMCSSSYMFVLCICICFMVQQTQLRAYRLL